MDSKAKHQTLRMCVGCRTKMAPPKLRRFVSSAQGIEFDGTIKQTGRGSYICSEECLARFSKIKLKTKRKESAK